ncbi:hypothetical protein C1S82_13055 [Mycolicibacterium cosmeticum]|nr:hypothetical protein C1S82_13055 [Mycolicibacterium cosmeticum]
MVDELVLLRLRDAAAAAAPIARAVAGPRGLLGLFGVGGGAAVTVAVLCWPPNRLGGVDGGICCWLAGVWDGAVSCGGVAGWVLLCAPCVGFSSMT